MCCAVFQGNYVIARIELMKVGGPLTVDAAFPTSLNLGDPRGFSVAGAVAWAAPTVLSLTFDSTVDLRTDPYRLTFTMAVSASAPPASATLTFTCSTTAPNAVRTLTFIAKAGDVSVAGNRWSIATSAVLYPGTATCG
jgi:hypothetical protein